jgi:DNA-directed RNA polymerase subunit RPC12/RpoP
VGIMATSGAGNFHSKKDWYSKCPYCGKKGWKYHAFAYTLEDEQEFVSLSMYKCRFCKESTRANEVRTKI